MKARRLTLLVVVSLVLILLIAPGSAGAGATRTACTGTETPIAVLEEGAWTFPDGNVHVRGRVTQYLETSDCAPLAGVVTSAMNANWDARFSGPMWGSGRQETPYGGGGVWEGTWQGQLNPDGSYTYQAGNRGVAGSVQGLHFVLNARFDPSTGVTSWSATILDPGGE